MIRRFWQKLRASDTLRVALGNAVGAGFGLVVLVMLTRSLGAEGFGTIAPALAIIDLGQLLIDTLLAAGVVTIASKRLSDAALATGLYLRIAAGCLYAALFVAGSLWLGPLVFPSGENGPRLVQLAGLAGGMMAIQSALMGGLQIEQKFNRVALVAASKNTLRLAVLALCLTLGWTAPIALTIGLCVSGGLALGVALWVSRPAYLRRGTWDTPAAKEMLGINKWMALAAIGIVSGRIDVLLLSSFSTPQDTAFYASAMQLCIAVGIVSQAIVTTQLPKVAHYETLAQARGYLKRWAKSVPFAALPVFIMPFLAPLIVPALLGPDFTGAGPVFSVLFASAMLTLIMNPMLVVLFPLGAAYIFGLTVFVQTLAKWAIAFGIIAEHGALGLAWADLATKLAASLIILFLLTKPFQSKSPIATQ